MQRATLIQTVFVSVASSAVTTLLVLSVAPQFASPQTGEDGNRIPPVFRDIDEEKREDAVVDTVARSQDAVVSVVVTKDLPVLERYYRELPFDNPFGLRIPLYREQGTERTEVGGGTAFFISDDGLLLTNKHVISDEEADYSVILNDGRTLPARVAARHPGNDIALLKVEGEDFPFLPLSSDEPRLGQSVIAIGNALAEFRNTVSVGIVSGLSRSITAGSIAGGAIEQLDRIIQTDAAINHGNSGGPLLDLEGSVIGMNTAIAGNAQNIGFAIPASDLRAALASYEEHGRIVQASLGVRYVPITPGLSEANGLPYDEGVLLVPGALPAEPAVVPGSPAARAGLLEGDILLEADGERITLARTLASIMRRKQPGDTLRLRVFSQGEERELTVTLEEMR